VGGDRGFCAPCFAGIYFNMGATVRRIKKGGSTDGRERVTDKRRLLSNQIVVM
jgi:hypothetical protein